MLVLEDDPDQGVQAAILVLVRGNDPRSGHTAVVCREVIGHQ
jgi:hypothetical protein